MLIILDLWPPSVNSIWRIYKNRLILSERGRIWYAQVAKILQFERQRFAGRVSVTIDLYPPTKRVYDGDNHAKGVLDALQRARIIENDSQVYELHIIKHDKTDGIGRVKVQICPLPNDPIPAKAMPGI